MATDETYGDLFSSTKSVFQHSKRGPQPFLRGDCPFDDRKATLEPLILNIIAITKHFLQNVRKIQRVRRTGRQESKQLFYTWANSPTPLVALNKRSSSLTLGSNKNIAYPIGYNQFLAWGLGILTKCKSPLKQTHIYLLNKK